MVNIKKLLLIIPLFLLSSFCPVAKAEIVFQDDFSYYDGTGWTPSTPANAGTIAGGTLQNPGRGEPHNWTGWIRSGSDYIGISPNEGVDGGACFKISNQITSQAGQVGLVKYLGENGYNELYIRFFMKFDENHRFGNGTNGTFNFYKVLRLWQGLTNQGIYDGSGTNSEVGKGAIIWGFYENAYAEFSPYYGMGAMRDGTNETVNCISNQSCINFSYYPYSSATNGGHLTSKFGPLTASGYWQNPQTWHQVDIHVKLASSFNGNDGIFEQWIDGVKQNNFTWVQLSSSGQVLTTESLPTARVGNGINYIVLNDNRDGTSYWATPSYVMYDNLTISTTPIESTNVIFEDNFDSQADWTPAANTSCLSTSSCSNPAPSGWSFYWTDEMWSAPSYNPVMQINSTNRRGSSGKGYTQYNESNAGNSGDGWGADGVLTKLLPMDYPELYAGMWIKFQPNWSWGNAEENMVKLFRIMHYDRTGNPNAFFSNGNTSPIAIFDLKRGTYGWRNTTSFRCDPQSSNYLCSWDESIDQRWGSSPYPDYTTPGQIMDTGWHWVEMHVKMNTNINGTWQADGQYHLWLDDNLIASKTNAAFIESGSDTSIGWNEVGIGGNSYNRFNDDHGEQWYAIDDFVISTSQIGSNYTINGSVQDTTAPTGSVSIANGNNYSKTTNVNLQLSATDSSGVSTMKISNSNNFSGATEVAYNSVYSWVLSASDGLKTVYAWFKDTIGNWMSSPASDTITLDTSAPVISQVGNISYSTGSTTPNITFSSTEAGSITYSGSCNSSTNQANVGNNNITFNSLSAGTYSNCTIRVTDAATNGSNTITIPQFTVQTSLPTCTSFTYSSWSSCQSNSTRTRTVVSSSPSSCTGGNPVLSESCTYISTCTSFTYSDWSSCQSNGTRTRTVLTSSPSSCSGGSPVTSESCTYTSGTIGSGGSSSTTSTSTTNQATSTQIITTQATSTTATTSSKIITNNKNTDQKIATSTNSTVSQSSSGEVINTLYGQSNEIVQKISLSEAKTISGYMSYTTLSANEVEAYKKISTQCTINEINKFAIAKFIHEGTLTTQKLGSGERAGVIGSFCKVYAKAPSTESDWQDIIKIANGRWPESINSAAEEKTINEWFKKIYQRLPNMKQANDNAAITIITYGLRPVTRNTQSEKNSINIFKGIFKYSPSSSLDWDIVRAIAYSGAKR